MKLKRFRSTIGLFIVCFFVRNSWQIESNLSKSSRSLVMSSRRLSVPQPSSTSPRRTSDALNPPDTHHLATDIEYIMAPRNPTLTAQAVNDYVIPPSPRTSTVTSPHTNAMSATPFSDLTFAPFDLPSSTLPHHRANVTGKIMTRNLDVP